MTSSVFVDASWLSDHLESTDLIVVDAREPYFYSQGHLPGAVSLPAISMRTRTGMPPPTQPLARRLGELGIARESLVILYDDGASASAAMLYWLLDSIGHPQAAIVNGGITAWHRAGLEIEYIPIGEAPVNYIVEQENAAALATLDDVQEAIGDPDSIILDVRSPAEYLGLQVQAARGGHIPGAVNIDWILNFDRGADGVAHLKSDDDLRLLYETAGAIPDKQVIVHCQSGSRSTMTYAVLKSIGFERVRNYAMGWEEWGNRDDTPIDQE
jgi:thiosulfate/3-mercaptopyruvate sulfurtransferase